MHQSENKNQINHYNKPKKKKKKKKKEHPWLILLYARVNDNQ